MWSSLAWVLEVDEAGTEWGGDPLTAAVTGLSSPVSSSQMIEHDLSDRELELDEAGALSDPRWPGHHGRRAPAAFTNPSLLTRPAPPEAGRSGPRHPRQCGLHPPGMGP